MKACPDCKEPMQAQRRTHRYDEIGFPGVILDDVTVHTCGKCGLQMVSVSSVRELHRRIALILALDPRRLSPAEFRFMRSVIPLEVDTLAVALGLRPETVARWESGVDPINHMGERLLRAIFVIEKGGYASTQEDFLATLTDLRPAVGQRRLRLKGRAITSQTWKIVEEPKQVPPAPAAPVLLVEKTEVSDTIDKILEDLERTLE
jgi:DNA-binding transcriptional regulator YiaG